MIALWPCVSIFRADTAGSRERKINEISLLNLQLALYIDNLEMHYLQNKKGYHFLFGFISYITY